MQTCSEGWHVVARNLVVVSNDPGMRCGWAVQRFNCKLLLRDGLIGSLRSYEASFGEYRLGSTSAAVDRHLDIGRAAYEDVCGEDDLFVWVQESFTLRMMSSDRELLEPVRFNAVLEDRLGAVPLNETRTAFATAAGLPLEYQSPGDAKKTMTDQRMKLWGIYDISHTPAGHAADAHRHGLLYARRWCADETVRLRSGWVG
jgi:hypothetical protein